MKPKRSLPIEFGKRLRTLRRERNLSQEQLGELSGLDRTYISSAEIGKRNVTLQTINTLAEALEVDPSVLVSEVAFQERA